MQIFEDLVKCKDCMNNINHKCILGESNLSTGIITSLIYKEILKIFDCLAYNVTFTVYKKNVFPLYLLIEI